jgi:hypothetical protein
MISHVPFGMELVLIGCIMSDECHLLCMQAVDVQIDKEAKVFINL